MVTITRLCQKPILEYNLGERIANLLNFSLQTFTSEKQKELKIENMKSYNFDPKFILTSIILIYINFSDFSRFLTYIVQDERCYNEHNFEIACSVKEKHDLKLDYDEYQRFKDMIVKLKESKLSYDSHKVFFFLFSD